MDPDTFFRPMAQMLKAMMSLGMSLLLFAIPANAARDTNSYDGNIYPIYAGNGSLVPPPNTLSESLNKKRPIVIVYYLDDSAASKAFAPVVSGLSLVWGSEIDLLPFTTDDLQGKGKDDPREPSYYWHGNIPQVVVLDKTGQVVFDQEGLVSIDSINAAITTATGISEPPFSITIKTFNEYSSEPSKDGYADPR